MHRKHYLIGAVFTLTLLLVCLFTSFIFVHAFALSGTRAHLLYLSTAGFWLLFILSFLTSRHSSGRGKSELYLFVMTVAVYGLYLFVVSIPLALILAIDSFSGAALALWIPTILFVTALTLGVIGHLQSSIFSLTHHTVTLPNLPEWWTDKRAVLVTDTHFGLVRQKRFAKKIVDAITRLGPDIVFHGGDFYDGPSIKSEEIIAVWKTLSEKVPTFYAPGNHELYGDYTAFIDSIRAASITVLEDAKTSHEGMHIAGITYRSKSQADDAAKAIATLDLPKDAASILINHPPFFHDVAHAAGVSLMLSGHTHNGQFWPANYIARAVFGKYTYGMKKFSDMIAITSRGIGTAGTPLRLFTPPELVVITFKKEK